MELAIHVDVSTPNKMVKIWCPLLVSTYPLLSQEHMISMSNIYFIGLQLTVHAHGKYQEFDSVQFLGHFVSNMFMSYRQRMLMININTRLCEN